MVDRKAQPCNWFDEMKLLCAIRTIFAVLAIYVATL
jgi:hypothetical protein